MKKTFFVAWLVVFVAWFAGSFLVHAVFLHDEYARLPNLFRTEEDAQKYFPIMVLAHVMLAGAFVWIYSRGVEATSWVGQGLRYGLAVSLLTTVPMCSIYYVVQPIPGSMALKQIVFGVILMLVLGLIVAFLYRRPTATTS